MFFNQLNISVFPLEVTPCKGKTSFWYELLLIGLKRFFAAASALNRNSLLLFYRKLTLSSCIK
jgi:hypothetical protein